MGAVGQHLMMRLVDGRVIAPEVGVRRRVARAVLEAAQGMALLAFRAADTHLHVLVGRCSRAEAMQLARRIGIRLTLWLRLPAGFAPARAEEVRDQRHLRNAFWYVLRQDERHGTEGFDARHDGSNLPDLLGLRVRGIWTADCVRSLLPRVRRDDLLERLGAPDLDARDPAWGRLREAAAAAACVTALEGKAAPVVAARRAAAHLAQGPLGGRRVAELLGIGYSSVGRLRTQPADPAMLRAVELQLRLRGTPPPA